MRHATKAIILTALTSTALSGCAQIGSAADTLWGGTKSAANWVYSPVRSLLRDAPEPEYAFAATDLDAGSPYAGADVVIYADAGTDDGTTSYASSYTGTYGGSYAGSYGRTYTSGYAASPVPSYGSGQFYDSEPVVQTAAIEPASSLSFVRLNGESDMQDWRNCEMIHRGYWKVDAAGGRINPDFEVCMRNKGYVQESELALYGMQGELPLRGSQANRGYVGGYVPLP